MGIATPRLSNTMLKGKSRIQEVRDLAESISMPLLPWQDVVLKDLLTVRADNEWVRKANLLLVARQNGKTHLARMRILSGMYLFGEKNLLMMAQNRAMALVTFREIAWAIENHDHLRKEIKQIRYANGQESIELKNGARLDVLAATRDSPRGRTADFLYVDELREVSEEAFRAATPTTRARPNSQQLYTSNAGDAFSTVLNNMRERALDNPPKTFGFWEYSATELCRIDDSLRFWSKEVAQANPALGHTITKEAIEESIAISSIETTRTETLTNWVDSLASPWPHGSLEETSDADLTLSVGAYTVLAFDVAPNRRTASLVAGQLLPDGRIGVGILEQWHSQVAVDDLKIAAGIKTWYDHFRPVKVCYDKYATETIAQKLYHSGVVIQDISGVKFYQACGDFLNAITSHKFVHNGQQEFIQQMNNVAAKTNDSGWRIVKRKSAGDISAPISAAMVIHELVKPQSKPMIISV